MCTSKEPTATTTKKVDLNLSALNGLRCLTCLAVILLHVHIVYGGLFFLSTDSCLINVFSIPLAGNLLFNVSFHMTLFWVMSGFLCEYQLTKLKNQAKGGQLGLRDYARFFLNRLLRLYPLYILFSVAGFFGQAARPDLEDETKCLLPDLISSSLFLPPLSRAAKCAGVGWSILPDVHGYIAIMLLFASFSTKRQWRKVIWWLAYGISLLRLVITAMSLDSNVREKMKVPFAFEYFTDQEVKAFDFAHFGLRSFHPDFDFEDPAVLSIQESRVNFYENAYLTSIGGHGSAMLLGSLLYMNLSDRNGQPQNVLFKLVAIVITFYLTKSVFIFTGISMYLLLDVILTLKPSGDRSLSAFVLSLVSNRFWTWLAPYTYGIYFSHLIFLVIGTTTLFPVKAALLAKGKDICDGYGIRFILVKFVRTSFLSLLTAIFLQYTVEWPFNYARKKWLRKKATSSIPPEKANLSSG